MSGVTCYLPHHLVFPGEEAAPAGEGQQRGREDRQDQAAGQGDQYYLRLLLLSAEIQFSFFPLSLRCFDDESEALSFDLVLPILWSMLRFSLELLDFIELDLLIDESTD